MTYFLTFEYLFSSGSCEMLRNNVRNDLIFILTHIFYDFIVCLTRKRIQIKIRKPKMLESQWVVGFFFWSISINFTTFAILIPHSPYPITLSLYSDHNRSFCSPFLSFFFLTFWFLFVLLCCDKWKIRQINNATGDHFYFYWFLGK